MRRFDCLKVIAAAAPDAIVVTNLANTASEWHAARPSDANLYCVGMGMVTSYGVGLALALPGQAVTVLDGDGGILFDISIFGVLAEQRPRLCIVVFDNGGYVSTGALPGTASMTSGTVALEDLARAFGLADVATVDTVEGFANAYASAQAAATAGPAIVIAKVSAEQAFAGALPLDLKESKYRFVRHIERLRGGRILAPSGKEHGAAPKPDAAPSDVDAGSRFADVLYDGLVDAGTNLVVGLPCSGLSAAQRRCQDSGAVTYVPVAQEGTGFGICAGAWLGGLRPAALVENFGLYAGVYHLLRGHQSYGIPTLIVAEYRGDTGDQEFFAETGELTEDVLRAMRVNYRVVDRLADLKPAIRDAWRWMDACLRPFVILPRFDLTRPRPQAAR